MDKLHKGINWTTLIGVIVTAAFGYLADIRHSADSDRIKLVVARELAATKEWRRGAEQDIDRQAVEIANLRETVAGLRAAVDLMSRGRQDVAGVLKDEPEVVVRAKASPPAPAPEVVQQVQSELFPK